ncbi:MAG: trehalose-phosphatase [Steroidobacteraceae bacterium]
MRSRAPAASRDFGLFLDVDGTLVELQETPADVVVGESLKSLLVEVSRRLQGAVALVSGRSIETLDALFEPLEFPAAGLHGVERRSASGARRGASYRDSALAGARATLTAFVESHPGTLLEDKGRALALHFRLAPEFETGARQAVSAAVHELASEYHVQEGKMVLEIKPSAFTKATAIGEFLEEAPFAGRRPVVVGDDLTDQAGFRLVEGLGGISIAVGHRVQGQWRLDNPAAVRRWLASIAALP